MHELTVGKVLESIIACLTGRSGIGCASSDGKLSVQTWLLDQRDGSLEAQSWDLKSAVDGNGQSES